MDESGEYDGEVRDIAYEEAQAALDGELELLHGIASTLLSEKYEEKGDGWQYEEARFHMWKGIDELFSATHYVDEGDLDGFERHVGHGLNHILMASFVSNGVEDLSPAYPWGGGPGRYGADMAKARGVDSVEELTPPREEE